MEKNFDYKKVTLKMLLTYVRFYRTETFIMFICMEVVRGTTLSNHHHYIITSNDKMLWVNWI